MVQITNCKPAEAQEAKLYKWSSTKCCYCYNPKRRTDTHSLEYWALESWSKYHKVLRYQEPCIHQHFLPTDAPREWHCTVPQQCQRPLVKETQRMWASSCLDIPLWSLISEGFPCQNPCLLQVSDIPENLAKEMQKFELNHQCYNWNVKYHSSSLDSKIQGCTETGLDFTRTTWSKIKELMYSCTDLLSLLSNIMRIKQKMIRLSVTRHEWNH